MKQVLVFLCVLVIAGSAFAQGSAPSTPSPFVRKGSSIENTINKTGPTILRFFAGTSPTTLDTITFQYDGAYFTNLSATWGLFDTVQVLSKFKFGGKSYTGLEGQRLRYNAGLLEVYFSTNKIQGSEIADSTIKPVNLDSTGSYKFANAYHVTSAVADSGFASLFAAKFKLGNTKVSAVSPAAGQDQYVWTYDFSKDSTILKVAPGASAGTTTKLDTSNAAHGGGAGKVYTATSYVLGLAGAAWTVTTGGGVDTLTATLSATNALKKNGDTASATGKTWNLQDGNLDSINHIDLDTALVDNLLNLQGSWVTNASQIIGKADSVLQVVATEPHGLWLEGGGTSRNIYMNGQGPGMGGTTTPTAGFIFQNNSLVGVVSTSASISSMNLFSGRQMTLGLFTKRPHLGDSTLNDSNMTTVKNVRDTINSYLTSNLANYVLKSAENWQDVGASGNIWSLKGTVDTALKVDRGISLSNTTVVTQVSGNLQIGATGSGQTTTIGGDPSLPISFTQYLTMSNKRIDSVSIIDADVVASDSIIKIAHTASSGAQKYVSFAADPSMTTSYGFTLPPAVGTGYLYSTNGVLGYAAGGSGGTGSGYPNWFNSTATTPGDSLLWTGSGISFTLTKNAYPTQDQVVVAASNLDTTMTSLTGGIARTRMVHDSLDAFNKNRNPWKRAGDTTYANLPVIGNNDSTFILGAASGVHLIDIVHTTTGGDTVHVRPSSGVGGEFGGVGPNWLAGDSVIVKNTAKGRVWFGNVTGGSTTSTYYMDSLRCDSIVRGLGHYAAGAGSGDITSVGSVTSAAAFSDAATTQGQSIGIPTAMAITFDTAGTGTHDNRINIPYGRLGIDNTTPLYNIDISRDTVSQVAMRINNAHAFGTVGNARLYIQSSTGGGNAYATFNDGGGTFSLGAKQAALSPLPAHSLVLTTDTTLTGSGSPSFLAGFEPNGVYGFIGIDTLYHKTRSLDSTYVTYGGVGLGKTEYVGLTSANLVWTNATKATIYYNKAKFATWPFVDTSGTFDSTTIASRLYMAKVYDSSAIHAATDTVAYVPLTWTADVACSLMTITCLTQEGAANADSCSWPSINIYKNGSLVSGGRVAVAVKSIGSVATTTADFTNFIVAPGDEVVAVLTVKMKQAGSTFYLQRASLQRKRV